MTLLPRWHVGTGSMVQLQRPFSFLLNAKWSVGAELVVAAKSLLAIHVANVVRRDERFNCDCDILSFDSYAAGPASTELDQGAVNKCI